MTDIEAIPPCARGCTYPPTDDDEPAKPKPATRTAPKGNS